MRSASARAVPHVLVIASLAMLLLIFRQWAYVTTYRLYLDQRIDDAARQWVRPWTSSSTATQRFDLEGTRVVPQILMSAGLDRVSFRTAIGKDTTIRAELRPEGRAGYEIHGYQDGTDRLLAQGEIDRATSGQADAPWARAASGAALKKNARCRRVRAHAMTARTPPLGGCLS